MKTDEELLWAEVERMAERFGGGFAYRSDLFLLLATIFAFYRERGAEPQEFINNTMFNTMANIRKNVLER